VCVGASGSTTASDDPSSSDLCVVCARRFPRGVPGGAGMPPLVTCNAPIFFFWAVFAFFGRFLLFLAVY
jgi:hypothetical protein